MIKTKILGLLLGTVIGFSGLSPIQAQMAPGANVRTTNETSRGGEMRIETTTPGSTTSAGSGTSTAPSLTSLTGTTDDPCPEPKTAMASTPDDLAKIQQDITRFTLCVQRAQLLERLNELAQANIDTIDTALNLTASQGIEGNAIPGIMPSQNNSGGNSAPAIPSVPSNLFDDMDDEDMSAPRHSGSNGAVGGNTSSGQSFDDLDWQIRGITGSDGKLTAQLIDTSGVIIRVSAGDDLPDEGWSVRSITNTRVEVENGDKRQPLKWVQ